MDIVSKANLLYMGFLPKVSAVVAVEVEYSVVEAVYLPRPPRVVAVVLCPIKDNSNNAPYLLKDNNNNVLCLFKDSNKNNALFNISN